MKLSKGSYIDTIDKTINFKKSTPGNYEIPKFSESEANI
jgi:hypothetical protein